MSSHGMLPPGFVYPLYMYKPSLLGASVAATVFGLLTVEHAVRMVKSRTYFMLPIVICCTMEFIGYVGRIFSAYHPMAIGPYSVQLVFILVAPTVAPLTIYIALTRLALTTRNGHLLLIPARFLTKVYLAGDIIAFGVQLTGAILLCIDPPVHIRIALKVLNAGLLIQLLSIISFLVVGVNFQIRMHRRRNFPATPTPVPWNKILTPLTNALGLIMARLLYRLPEFAMGPRGLLAKNEWIGYLGEMMQIAFFIILLLVFHPGRIVKGVEQMMGQGQVQEQHGDDGIRLVASRTGPEVGGLHQSQPSQHTLSDPPVQEFRHQWTPKGVRE